MRKLGQMSTLFLLSLFLQVLGAWLNGFTMNHNVVCSDVDSTMGHITVCRPVMPYLYYGVDMDDFRHARITKDTHYLLFTDYIPVPTLGQHGITFGMESLGDVFLSVSELIILFPLFMAAKMVRAKLVKKEQPYEFI